MDSFDFNPDLYRKEARWQEGDLTVTRTMQWSAPGCHCGCSILCYTDRDGKLVKVEGDPQSGMTNGRLCMRCFDLVNQVYHEDRILHPMKRAREDRGKDKWERITWDEAYDMIEKKAKQIIAEDAHHNGRSIMCTQGTGRNIMWVTRFLAYQCFDSPTIMSGFLSGDSCYVPRVSAMQSLTGGQCVADVSQFFEDHFDNPAYRLPDQIVVWGSNTLVSSSDGFYAPLLSDCIKRGSKLIVVDPRVTWMGAKAEHMLQLRPGTDGALALGILSVIINEGLYDKDFVDKWCYGFDELCGRVSEWSAARAAEITWVPEEKIVAAARAWATGGTTALQWGLALDMQTGGVGASHGVMCIEAITGNIEQPGGMILATRGSHVDHPYDVNDWTFTQNGIDPDLCKDRVGYGGRFAMRSGPNGNGPSSDDMINFLEDPNREFDIRMVVSFANNWIACMAAQQNRVHEAMKNIEFCVVGDVFMNPTAAAYGDLFLPVAMGPERDGVRDWFVPIRAITKCTQTGEAKSDDEIAYDIYKRMHPERCFWGDYLEMTDYFIHDVNRMHEELGGRRVHLDELQREVTIYPERKYRRYETGELRSDGGLGFETTTGRIELWSTVYARLGLDPLPNYIEPYRSPISTPEIMEEYPFVLTTGARVFESNANQLTSMDECGPSGFGAPYKHPVSRAEITGCKRMGTSLVWGGSLRGQCWLSYLSPPLDGAGVLLGLLVVNDAHEEQLGIAVFERSRVVALLYLLDGSSDWSVPLEFHYHCRQGGTPSGDERDVGQSMP